ncbi:MAG TPA: NAD(P)H-dependent oxidoreductase subunit E [Blastocatellia bacterium]|nr:NAD(P)H-dependent oxidoreductase subunit E [Blastocatellia bacterium]
MHELEPIIERYQAQRRFLIPILQDIQAEYHYLSPEALRYVAERLRVPLIDVYGVATFYNCFSLRPRGKHFIRVCMGTTCHLKGGWRLVETLQRDLKVQEGEVTRDGLFSYQTVRCVGACALAPLVLIGEKYYAKMSSRRLQQTIQRIQRAEAREKAPQAGVSTVPAHSSGG